MLKNVSYCPECEELIRSFGGIAFAIYMQICEGYIFHKHEDILDDEERIGEIVRFLEQKKFILTTESSRKIISCIPRGYMKIGNKHFFCINPKKHSSRNV